MVRVIMSDGYMFASYLTGNKAWYLNGKPHREVGPAIELSNGTKKWCQHGRLHRTDGPAIEWSGGYKQWWINGSSIFKHE